MASNQEILTFLKANQDALAKEKEDEKKTRATERQEDREHILKMIKLGIQREVKSAVEVVELRLKEQEKINQKLSKELVLMVRDMELLKKTVQNQAFPSFPCPDVVESVQGEVDVSENSSAFVADEYLNIPAVSRTLGFQSIYPADVERQFRINGASNMDEARLLAFREFAQFEMRVSSGVFDSLVIEKIFPPAKENWDILYVQFASVTSVETFYKFSRHLRKCQRLVPYITKELYPRFRQLQNIAYTLRHSSMKYKTRVRVQNNNIFLFKRKPSESTWTSVQISRAAADPQTKFPDSVQLNLRPQPAFSFRSRSTSSRF